MHWDKFIKYAESKRNFLLYLTKNLYIIIPKAKLAKEDVDDLRDLLHKK